jgi:PKD repeat protein
VPRPGVAALDPANGVPFSWNPGRNPRGAGAYAVYATPTGLWVGSDTDWIGNFQYKRGKMAFFPLAGGSAIPANFGGRLPNNVVIGAPTGATTTAISRPYDGTTAGANTTLPSSGLDWSTVRGAVMVDGKVFYGLATDSNLYWRTFDGTTFGPANLINPYQDPAWAGVDTGSGQTYIGVKSGFYPEIPNVTSMFFSGARLYYTLATSSSLFYRYFTPESGILGSDRFTVAGTTNWSDTGGAFLDGTNLYLTSRSTGNLRRISWVNGVPGTTSTTVSGPAVDGKDWRGRAVFLSTVAANVPPTAAFTVSCGGLSCTVDASGSTDSDGSITSYAWTFGDGTTGTGASVTHAYGAAGTYSIGLTVTDNRGGSGSTSQPVTVSVPTAAIAFRGAANSNANGTTSTVTLPAAVQAGDALVLTATVNADAVTVSDPAGWARIDRASTTGIQTVVWSKVATATDASAAVSVTLGGTVKTSLTVAAWSGTSATAPVATLASKVDTVTTTTHTTPTVTVATPGSWVVSYWADKSSSTTAWTAPAGQSVRNTSIGASTGRITSLLTDGGGVAAPGSAGGLTATTDLAGTKATSYTLVLSPAS